MIKPGVEIDVEGGTAAAGAALLEVTDLRVAFGRGPGAVCVVRGACLRVARGQALAVVGESGSGKSVSALALMGLLDTPPAAVAATALRFAGRELLGLNEAELRRLRGRDLAMIFQDPMASLNPYMRIGRQLSEVLTLHLERSEAQARAEVVAMLERVGIGDAQRRYDAFPHELSGGMRQRVMIAMALLCRPQLLIADEPTTALDVTVQAEILDLIASLQAELGMAVLLITHDLGIVARLAQRVAVMYAGQVVEEGPVQALLQSPLHPYSAALLRSRPRMDADPSEPLPVLDGAPPEPARLPTGCAFHPRCAFAGERCRVEEPGQTPTRDGGHVRCFLHQPGGVHG